MEEQVRLVTSEGNKQVATNPDTWSMQPVPPSSSAAAVASESENVAAAAMGAMVPRSPLQKHLPELQIRTRAAFEEDFDECLNMTGKKNEIGRGRRRCCEGSVAQGDRHFAGSQVVQAGSIAVGGGSAAPHGQDKGARSFDLVHF